MPPPSTVLAAHFVQSFYCKFGSQIQESGEDLSHPSMHGFYWLIESKLKIHSPTAFRAYVALHSSQIYLV